MKIFVDVRDQGIIAVRFAWWDTVQDAFECHSGNYAWNTWLQFVFDYEGPEEISRYKSLCPEWMF